MKVKPAGVSTLSPRWPTTPSDSYEIITFDFIRLRLSKKHRFSSVFTYHGKNPNISAVTLDPKVTLLPSLPVQFSKNHRLRAGRGLWADLASCGARRHARPWVGTGADSGSQDRPQHSFQETNTKKVNFGMASSYFLHKHRNFTSGSYSQLGSPKGNLYFCHVIGFSWEATFNSDQRVVPFSHFIPI